MIYCFYGLKDDNLFLYFYFRFFSSIAHMLARMQATAVRHASWMDESVLFMKQLAAVFNPNYYEITDK